MQLLKADSREKGIQKSQHFILYMRNHDFLKLLLENSCLKETQTLNKELAQHHEQTETLLDLNDFQPSRLSNPSYIQYSSVVRGLPGGHCCCSIPGRHGFNKRQPSHFLGRVSDGTPGHPPPTSAGQSLPPHVGRDSQNVENSPTNVIWKFFLQAKITFYKGLFISQRMRY